MQLQENKMNPAIALDGERFDVAYLVLSGTSTAARCPELLRELVGLGFSTVMAIPTPNASRVVAPREVADVEEVQTRTELDLSREIGRRLPSTDMEAAGASEAPLRGARGTRSETPSRSLASPPEKTTMRLPLKVGAWVCLEKSPKELEELINLS
jgi:hypothetical protein